MSSRRLPAKPRRTPPKPRRKPGPTREWWEEVTQVLVTRSRGRCERCGVDMAHAGMERHHRKLRSQGGGHQVPNLVAVCPSCHRDIHSHPEAARESGWICPRGHDPAVWALQLHDGSTVVLDGDGGYQVVFPASRVVSS